MSKYVKAPQLNRRARFERKTGDEDDLGQPLDDWVEAFTCWASVETISGMGFVNQEFVAGDQEVSRTTASIRIRMRTTWPTPDLRVVVGGRVYEIRVVLPDTRDNRFLNIGVAQGANNG